MSVTDRRHGSAQRFGLIAAATSVAAVARRILPSVVSIQVKLGASGDTGSGIVLSTLRLHHDQQPRDRAARIRAATLSVILPDKSQVPATVVGAAGHGRRHRRSSRSSGVNGLMPAVIGDSDDLAVGDPVVAVGSPLGLAGTVTSGIVSRAQPSGGGRRRAWGRRTTSSTRSRPTPRSTRATPAARWSTVSGRVVGVNSAIASLSTDFDHEPAVGQHRPRLRDPDQRGEADRGADHHPRLRDPRDHRRAARQLVRRSKVPWSAPAAAATTSRREDQPRRPASRRETSSSRWTASRSPLPTS